MPPQVRQGVKAEDYDIKMARRIRARAVANTRRPEPNRTRLIEALDVVLVELESDPAFGLNRRRRKAS